MSDERRQLGRRWLPSAGGFTLVEITVGILVLALLGTSLLFAVTTVTRSAQISGNHNSAVHILQKSQEEVRKVSQSIFDTIESCQFPGSPLAGSDCGFDDLDDFPGFTRTLRVDNSSGDAELKKVQVTVEWQELGRAQRMDSVVMLTRPPDPLPGNIRGTVRSAAAPGALIRDVIITVTKDGTTDSRSTNSTNVLDANSNNYDFKDTVTGGFQLPAGTWHLIATHEHYEDYTHPNDILVPDEEAVDVDFTMEPKPENARIYGDVVDARNSNTKLPSFANAEINIFDDSTGPAPVFYNQTSYSYEVEFERGETERCFTINTTDAFMVGYAFETARGGSPSCVYGYNREGWSSAVVLESGALACGNPYNGSAQTDRVCVHPGDPDKRVDIPLHPVPKATITGRVIDNLGNPVANATIRARWPRSDQSDWRIFNTVQTARSDANGRFTFIVPAVQDMFPVDTRQASFSSTAVSQSNLQVWASAGFSVQGCCDLATTTTVNSPTYYVGPLYNGGGGDMGDITIQRPSDQVCGNVQGRITNGRNGSGVGNARVQISSINQNTQINGDYLYQCPDQGYRIREGTYAFFTNLDCCYYPYDSRGNTWYGNGPDPRVLGLSTIDFYARIWPKGFGNLQVRVIDAGSRIPLQQMRVTLSPYTGSSVTRNTDGAGQASFTSVLETWPPPTLPNDSYYNRTARTHTVRVEDPSGIYLPEVVTIDSLRDGETLPKEIPMTKQGGL